MRQQVIFVKATIDDPNMEEINAVCSEMAERGLALASSATCEGVNKQGLTSTVGMWLFFSDLNVEEGTSTLRRGEEEYVGMYPTATPRRWSP